MESTIDRDVLDEMNAKKVDTAISDEREFRRAELNFYAELLSQLHGMTKKVEDCYVTLNMIGAERLTQYFKEFSQNWKEEEKRIAITNKVVQGHKKPKSSKE